MRKAYAEIYFIFSSFLIGLVVSGAAQAQMAGTPHDLGRGICENCHTPAMTPPPDSPRWNRQASAKARFTMYDSPTIVPATGGQPHGVSLVCLACHDGVISHNTLLKSSGFVTARSLTGKLAEVGRHGPSNRHPISINYDRNLGLDFNAAEARNVGGLPLYRSPVADAVFNHVECASCHNPHDMTYGRYLRMDNASSALCLTCHIK